MKEEIAQRIAAPLVMTFVQEHRDQFRVVQAVEQTCRDRNTGNSRPKQKAAGVASER